MSGDLMAVIEQILDDGYLSTETLAQLRAAYQQSGPQSGYSADLRVPPADGHLAGDKPAPAEPVAWMVYTLDGKSVCVTDNPTDFTPQHRALPLYTAPQLAPDALREAARMALEVLEALQGGCTDSDDGTVEAITVHCPEVIAALRDALGDRA